MKRVTAKNLTDRCMDCGRRGEWKRTKRGTYALRVAGKWHWWHCPRQKAARSADMARKAMEDAGVEAIHRDRS